jgi:gas vesicle protein
MADHSDSFFKGLIFGGIIGGVLGVLYAPKSGKETREELSVESEKLLNQFKTDIENAKKAALKSFDQGKDIIIDKLASEEDDIEEKASEDNEELTEEKKMKRKRSRASKPKREKDS